MNFWLPVYELTAKNAMAFHPTYRGKPVQKDSHKYNYDVWNKIHRGPAVATLIKDEPRPLRRATERIALDTQIRLRCQVGGLIIFSGAQMHSSAPNTSGRTRFSIDFRTVHLDHSRDRRGATRTDEARTGTTLQDYFRATDLARLPDEVIALYDDETIAFGDAVYRPR